MNKLLIIASAAAATAFALPAMATPVTGDVTGQMNVSGQVTAKCANLGSATVDLDVGELADANGSVVSDFAQNKHAEFTVTCTGAAPQVTVAATPLTGPASPPSGYTNLVQYKATATVADANGGSVAPYVLTDGSNPLNSNVAVLAAAIATGTGNVKVDLSNPTAVPGSRLIAGNYTGTVTVTVAPTS
jgi:hypothetical protein